MTSARKLKRPPDQVFDLEDKLCGPTIRLRVAQDLGYQRVVIAAEHCAELFAARHKLSRLETFAISFKGDACLATLTRDGFVEELLRRLARNEDEHPWEPWDL